MWTHLPEVAKACQELLKCGCKALPLCSRKCSARKLVYCVLVCAIVKDNVILDFLLWAPKVYKNVFFVFN